MTEARVRAEDRGLVRVVTFDNRAKRNALDFRALEELEAAFEAAARERVRCLLLRGAGQDAFSSGFDLDEIALLFLMKLIMAGNTCFFLCRVLVCQIIFLKA